MSESPMRDVSLKPACVHLRHKLMYVDERQATPGMVDDSSDTRVFFCGQTLEVLGQDGEPVGPRYCDPTRSCYCGIRNR
ncbi:MAG: hypothetical protein KDA21_14860 [Phycisphaerales bacterium]|nr:hypothetical protein [Phycisphaerales bacterium]